MDDFYTIRDSILRYAQEQFGAEPDHPWARYPGNIVLRHSNNSKWYALFMDVPRNKLGLSGAGLVPVLNLKCDPILMGGLLAKPGILPAYHMSKTSWITVLLDSTISDEEIFTLLNLSYDLTRGTNRKGAPGL